MSFDMSIHMELPISYVRFKVNTSEIPRWWKEPNDSGHYGSIFPFKGRSWYLYYSYSSSGHYLYLCTHDESHVPFDVTINVKSGSTGRIIPELTWKCLIGQQSRSPSSIGPQNICEISEADILRLDPMYRLTHCIEFLVVLKEAGDPLNVDFDWYPNPKGWQSLSGDFGKLLEDPRTANIQLLCGDLTIPAHGIILSARSEVFEKMLQTEMLEKATGSIKITDIEPQTIKEFVKYLYTGELPPMALEKASRLYEAGDKYNVPSLVAECGSYLGNNLSKNNVCKVIVLADKYNNLDLKKRAIDFISTSPLIPESWKKFSKKRPKLELEAVQFAYKYLHNKSNVYRRRLRRGIGARADESDEELEEFQRK